MKITVLLVTYNQSQYIIQCLDSIIMQRLNIEMEIIVADDHLTDDTLSIISEYAKICDPKFIFLESKFNQGFVKNYKRAFEACDGDYIAVMEGDDYWIDPKRLQKHVDFLETDKGCVLSMNRFISLNEVTCDYTTTSWNLPQNFCYVTGSEMALENRLGNMSACVFRRSEVAKLKPDLFELQVADWMIGMVLSENGRIVILREAMSVYRIHPKGQLSQINEKEQLEKMKQLIEQYNKYLDFKYDHEFNLHKNRLNGIGESGLKRFDILDHTTQILIPFFKLLIPSRLLRFFRKT